jgi:acyl-CoA reductase-like NAD-dependent aldehyde dehydrogenase
MDASRRGELMNKLADLMEENIVELASLETYDNGKPYVDSYDSDITLSIKCFRLDLKKNFDKFNFYKLNFDKFFKN